MVNHHSARAAIILILVMLSITVINAGQPDMEPVSLTPRIGQEIDSSEREYYNLFPDIENFISAWFYKVSEKEYKLIYTHLDYGDQSRGERKISDEIFNLTRHHIELKDRYFALKQREPGSVITEPEMMFKLSLKYAARTKYDISNEMLNDIVKEYPESSISTTADSVNTIVSLLRKSDKVLFKKGSLIDQSGRTSLIVFSGYYGIWLGIAVPAAFDAEETEAYALGMLLGPSISVYAASGWSRNSNITKSKAKMISAGAHFGTLQGIGWTVYGDAKSHEVIGTGVLSGLAGILVANHLSNSVDYTEGQASLIGSSFEWGMWYGGVFAAMADVDDDEIVLDILIGSDIALLSACVFAPKSNASTSRIRLINLAGIVGAVAGFGIDILAKVDDDNNIMSLAGAGSFIGLLTGIKLTSDYDNDRKYSYSNQRENIYAGRADESSTKIAPVFSFKKYNRNSENYIPYVGLKIDF